MQFLSPVVDPTHRHQNASPEQDGYGHETFVMSSSSTGSSVFSTSSTSGEQLLLNSRIVILPCEIAVSVEKAAAAISETDLSAAVVIFDQPCIPRISADVVVLLKHHGAVAIAAATERQNLAICHEGSGEQCRSALPLLLGLDINPRQPAMRKHLDRIFVLPLRFGHFCPSQLPATIYACEETLGAASSSRKMKMRLVHDCTMRLTSSSPVFPGPGAQLPLVMKSCPAANLSPSDSLLLSEDVGTHCDAAKHFFSDLRGIDGYAAHELSLLPAVIIDISARAEKDPDATLEVGDILAFERAYGSTLKENSLVCMRSGWGDKFTCASEYVNQMHFPGFSKAAAEFLVKERGAFAGLGVDTLSVDAGANTDFEVHTIVLGDQKGKHFHVENMHLPNISPALQRGNFFIVAPIRVRGAYEAPARVVLVEIEE